MHASEKEEKASASVLLRSDNQWSLGGQFPVSLPLESMRIPGSSVPPLGNPRTETDIRNVIKFSTWILSPLGIWPGPENKHRSLLSKISVGLGNLVLCFAIVPCALHIAYEEKDTYSRLRLLGLLSFCTSSAMKYCALVARKSAIRWCVEHVKRDWMLVELRQDREMMLKYGRVGRNLTVACATFLYTGGMIYHTIVPFVVSQTTEPWNTTTKPLVYPTYSAIFDAQVSPVYEFVFLAHCMCGYVICSVTSGACGLAALFAMHACGQADIVMSRIDALVDGQNSGPGSDPKRRLTVIVRYHLRVLRFAMMTERTLQEVCLLEFGGSTFLICLLEFYCIMDWQQSNIVRLTTYALLLVSLTFNIFILCYIGELLMEKTSSVGMRCFSIEWHRLPVKTMRDLNLVIAISNNPIKISAGKMADLSLFTFGNILKTSLAYLSFLRTAAM